MRFSAIEIVPSVAVNLQPYTPSGSSGPRVITMVLSFSIRQETPSPDETTAVVIGLVCPGSRLIVKFAANTLLVESRGIVPRSRLIENLASGSDGAGGAGFGAGAGAGAGDGLAGIVVPVDVIVICAGLDCSSCKDLGVLAVA